MQGMAITSDVIRPARARVLAVIWMLSGIALLVSMLIAINTVIEKDTTEKKVSSVHFEVKQNTKKPKAIKKTKKIKAKSKKITPPSVSMDLLNMQLSGIDLGLSAFAADDIGEVDAKLIGDTRNVVMNSDMVDEKASAKYTVPVTYPARARAKEIEGFVTLSLLISAKGKVLSVKIIEADPAGVFDSSAINAVKKWLFDPAKYKGDAVKSWANQSIRFTLD